MISNNAWRLKSPPARSDQKGMRSGLRLSLLAVRFGLLLALAGVSPIPAHAPAYAEDTALPAGYESYLSRPDVLKLKPKAHPELRADWPKLKRGHIEAVAMLLEMYPDRELYFLARDSELLYDLARWITRDDPAVSKRLHLLNVSRANMRDAHIQEYLAQEGISEATLKAGKKVLFVDTGFSGTIPRALSEYFPQELRKNLQTHLMSSSNSEHPSTRVFLTAINPAAPGLSPANLHGSIVSYEHMPRYTDRSTTFAKYQGTWQPISLLSSQSDGAVSKDKALAHMEDLLSYTSEKETQGLLSKRRLQWKRLREAKSTDEMTQEIKSLLEAAPQDPFAEALVRDFAEIHELRGENAAPLPDLEKLGLKSVNSATGYQSNKNHLIKKYPEWASVLEDPQTGISDLILKEEFGKLGAIMDTIKDEEFIQILSTALGKAPQSAKVRQFVKMLIEKNDPMIRQTVSTFLFREPESVWLKDELRHLIEIGDEFVLRSLAASVFSRPHTKEMGDLLAMLIEKADSETLRFVSEHVFSRAHTAGMKKELRLLIETAGPIVYPTLARYVFSQPHTAEMKNLVRLLIENGDSHTWIALAQDTFSQPHTKGMSDLIRLLIDKGEPKAWKMLAYRTFSQPHTAEMKDLIRVLIEKGDPDTLQHLAISTFSQPHTTGMRDLLNLLIDKGDARTLMFLGRDTFSKPHTANMNGELRHLIEKGDSATLEALAMNAFFKTHSAGMKDELRLLIKKADAHVLKTIAAYVFGQSHTAGMEDEFRFLIAKADEDTLQFISREVLRRPHWYKDQYRYLREATTITNPKLRRAALTQGFKPISPDLTVGDKIWTEDGRSLEVVRFRSGDRAVIYQMKGLDGRTFALKVPRGSESQDLSQDAAKAALYRKHHLPHAEVLEAQPGYLLKEWIEGERTGDGLDEKKLQALNKLIQRASENGIALGERSVKNLIWHKDQWVIVDSGDTETGPTAQGGACLSKTLKELLKSNASGL